MHSTVILLQKDLAGEVISPRIEPDTVILINGYVFKVLYSYLFTPKH